ncbi:hypothetical protein ACFL2C_03125 [Patescibacteria group bacterium]
MVEELIKIKGPRRLLNGLNDKELFGQWKIARGIINDSRDCDQISQAQLVKTTINAVATRKMLKSGPKGHTELNFRFDPGSKGQLRSFKWRKKPTRSMSKRELLRNRLSK